MATPLTDEIRQLIAYANIYTGAGDTKLGDAIRTLCRGYGGSGDNAHSFKIGESTLGADGSAAIA